MQIRYKLPVLILKEGRHFIAFTPVLDLSTAGKTARIAKDRLFEAANIFFEELIAKGTFEEVLENLGWQKIKKQMVPPTVVSSLSENITVSALKDHYAKNNTRTLEKV